MKRFFSTSWMTISVTLFTIALGWSATRTVSTESTREPAANASLPKDYYLTHVQPILSRRCVICHACYESPCDLNLTSFRGLERGALQTALFKRRSQSIGAVPNRLKDESSVEGWRKKGYHSVLPDPAGGEADLASSILFRMLAQGQQHNQAGFNIGEFDAVQKATGGNACVDSVAKHAEYSQKYPAGGMPYGLPAIPSKEYEVITTWLSAGSPAPTAEAIRKLERPAHAETIDKWEDFFNGANHGAESSNERRTVARFIYEHTVLAIYVFKESPGDFYELVRSTTPPGTPIAEILTDRASDGPPSGQRVFYRLRKLTNAVSQKVKLIWKREDGDIAHLENLFFSHDPKSSWKATQGWALKYVSNNPFGNFREIPARIRSQFMLENAKLIVGGMMIGPVCSSSLATFAIREQFWLMFMKPDRDPSVRCPDIAIDDYANGPKSGLVSLLMNRLKASIGMRLPDGVTDKSGKNWVRDLNYHRNFARALKKTSPQGYTPTDVWDGDGVNSNGFLTILRHAESATVHYGLLGGTPDSIGIMSFSNFERMYYDLVVDFIPWGPITHKLASWNFMSRLRTEAEERFISFLPIRFRNQVRSRFTDFDGKTSPYRMISHWIYGRQEAHVTVDPNHPEMDLLTQMVGRIPEEVTHWHDPLNWDEIRDGKPLAPAQVVDDASFRQGIASFTNRMNLPIAHTLPEVVVVRTPNHQVYSLSSDKGWRFNDFVIEASRLGRKKSEDKISAYPGVISARIFMFVDLTTWEKADQFIRRVRDSRQESDWTQIQTDYGIARNDARFWEFLDWLEGWRIKEDPVNLGVFDVRRYE